MSTDAMLRVGLISDTHGLLRPEAKAFLHGCDFIVHGGDIGNSEILRELTTIAPVTAIRGNNDKGAWAEQLAEEDFLQVGEIFVYVVHDLAEIQIDPKAEVPTVASGNSTVRPNPPVKGTCLRQAPYVER